MAWRIFPACGICASTGSSRLTKRVVVGAAWLELNLPEGGSAAVFLKRQENHGYRTWRHPWSGIPTFAREFANTQQLREIGVPTLEPVYFAMDRQSMAGRAILLTRAGWL